MFGCFGSATLFKSQKKCGRIRFAQIFLRNNGVELRKRGEVHRRSGICSHAPTEAEKPPEIKPWLRRVVEAAGVWLSGMTCGEFLR
jgi:hypothetical protein